MTDPASLADIIIEIIEYDMTFGGSAPPSAYVRYRRASTYGGRDYRARDGMIVENEGWAVVTDPAIIARLPDLLDQPFSLKLLAPDANEPSDRDEPLPRAGTYAVIALAIAAGIGAVLTVIDTLAAALR